mmetsp:Transcript_23689/g.75523  ORF Transcript_23689/g.75523 Transcript_23689/m.75523 type:complete len:210 (+) Transcript_23689:462-1091(+)
MPDSRPTAKVLTPQNATALMRERCSTTCRGTPVVSSTEKNIKVRSSPTTQYVSPFGDQRTSESVRKPERRWREAGRQVSRFHMRSELSSEVERATLPDGWTAIEVTGPGLCPLKLPIRFQSAVRHRSNLPSLPPERRNLSPTKARESTESSCSMSSASSTRVPSRYTRITSSVPPEASSSKPTLDLALVFGPIALLLTAMHLQHDRCDL